MLDNLRVAVMESEERSDVTAEKFINGVKLIRVFQG